MLKIVYSVNDSVYSIHNSVNCIINSVTEFVNNLLVRRVEWVVVLKPRLLQSNALLTFH